MATTNNIQQFDKSRIMRRAWYLTKNQYGSFAFNLKKVWKEFKEYAIKQAEQAKLDLIPEYQGCKTQPSAEAMYNFYHGAGASEYKGD